MFQKLRLLVTNQYRQEAKKWLATIARRENLSISFFPKTDRIIRLEQLLHDKELITAALGHPSRYHFQLIDFSAPAVEDSDDLEVRISSILNGEGPSGNPRSFPSWIDFFQKNKRTLVLVITEAEKLLNPIGKSILTLLSYMIDRYYPNVLVMSIFETQVSHPSHVDQLPPSTRLYANIFEYPLYSASDTRLFIELLEKEWNISVSPKDKDHIVDNCGGHFWLVKEAVRRIAAGGKWSTFDEGMVFRLRTIFEQTLPVEQSVLKKIIAGKSDFSSEERVSIAYLERMRVIDKDQKKCAIGMFNDYILRYEEKPAGLNLTNSTIYLNNVPIDKFFSRKEHRVLRLLLEKDGKVATRNDIANAIWPTDTEKQYSDWAIDQIIARLRKRLLQLYISPKMLQSVRGKGYLFNLSK